MIAVYLTLISLLRAVLGAFKDREFQVLVVLMAALLLGGTLAYAKLEGWDYVDALFFCFTTMSTIGYGKLVPSTAPAKIFTIVYALASIGVFASVVTKLAVQMAAKPRRHDSRAQG